MKFDIKSRWTSKVIFTAEIDADENTPYSVKLGLAVKSSVKYRANLAGANLSGADLSCADLSGAYMASMTGSSASRSRIGPSHTARM